MSIPLTASPPPILCPGQTNPSPRSPQYQQSCNDPTLSHSPHPYIFSPRRSQYRLGFSPLTNPVSRLFPSEPTRPLVHKGKKRVPSPVFPRCTPLRQLLLTLSGITIDTSNGCAAVVCRKNLFVTSIEL
ncbi:hypothetical protein E2C01_059288 [Portunus trituberculatus]|uniref:Uncharacterized protein n=1 Tax=Portunus trituberculatus TaxID=210409 RepID=A0A5B7H5N1_PORTR|nr:hypothetical protein [Portunus trituberculatus]